MAPVFLCQRNYKKMNIWILSNIGLKQGQPEPAGTY